MNIEALVFYSDLCCLLYPVSMTPVEEKLVDYSSQLVYSSPREFKFLWNWLKAQFQRYFIKTDFVVSNLGIKKSLLGRLPNAWTMDHQEIAYVNAILGYVLELFFWTSLCLKHSLVDKIFPRVKMLTKWSLSSVHWWQVVPAEGMQACLW